LDIINIVEVINRQSQLLKRSYSLFINIKSKMFLIFYGPLEEISLPNNYYSKFQNYLCQFNILIEKKELSLYS